MQFNFNQLLSSDYEQKTGELIIKLLEQQAGVSLPSSGILAGQAVTSALLQLCNLPGVVYNDIDIFCGVGHSGEFSKYGYIHSFAGTDIATTETTFRQPEQVLGTPLWQSEEEEYMPLNLASSYNLVISNVFRKSDLNFIESSSLNTYARKHDNALNVLAGFDINNVQSAVDLSTGIFYHTGSFERWITTRQLRVDHIHTGFQTLVRLLEKASHKGNFVNFELELAKCYSHICAGLLTGYVPVSKWEQDTSNDEWGGPQVASKFYKQHQDWVMSTEYQHGYVGANSAKSINLSKIGTDCLEKEGWATMLDFLKRAPVPEKLSSLRKMVNHTGCGVSLIGSKYYGRSFKHPVLQEYFECVPVEGCYLVIPKKIPSLIMDHPAAFSNYMTNRGVGFFGYHKSESCPTIVADKTVSKVKRDVVESLLGLSEIEKQWVVDKSRSFCDISKSVPPNILVGSKDPSNPKYLSIYKAHRSELDVFLKAESIREFKALCKTLYLNVESTFAKDDFLFYAILAKIKGALNNQHLIETGALNPMYAPAPALDMVDIQICKDFYAQGLKKIVSKEFVEYCLALHLKLRENAHKQKITPLVEPLDFATYNLEFVRTNDIQIRELVTPQELEDEGLRMKHCVGGYSYAIKSGRSRIFSLNYQGSWSTLELHFHEENDRAYYKIAQNRANRNEDPVDQLKECAKTLVQALNDKLQQIEQKTVEVEPCPFESEGPIQAHVNSPAPLVTNSRFSLRESLMTAPARVYRVLSGRD